MEPPVPRSDGRPLLLGHRGCRGTHPENTFAAFDHALASGCDGFEFDVRLTGDLQCLIWHDETVRGSFVSSVTYADILKQCMSPGGGLFRAKPGIQLCSLDEVLERYAQRAWLNIELKVTGAEQLTIDLCRKHQARRVVVSSFLPDVVIRFRTVAPEIPVGFIFDHREGLRLWRDLPTTHLMPHHRLLSAELIGEMHSAGRQVITWTVNDPKRMKLLADWGIDGLVSDDPVLLSNSFGGKRRQAT